MAATPTSKPILHAIVPRIAVGNAEQTQAFYGRIGFACTHQEEGFMIVERDGVQLHLHPSNEPPTRHICDPFRNIFIFAENLTEEEGSVEQAR